MGTIRVGKSEIQYEKVYKGIGGYKPAADDNHVPTHVLLSEKGWNFFVRTYRNLNTAYMNEKETHKADVRAGADALDYEQKKAARAMAEAVSTVRNEKDSKIKSLREDVQHERDLNYHLKNAAKERANRKRRLDKHGPAYRPLTVSSFSHKVIRKEGKKMISDYWELYRITLQTYFECSVPLNTVDREILRDIDRQELKLCGSKPYYNKNREIALDTELISMRYADIEHEGEKDYIPWRRYESIIRRDYRCDFQKGYWEVTFITNFPYEAVIDGGDDVNDGESM